MKRIVTAIISLVLLIALNTERVAAGAAGTGGSNYAVTTVRLTCSSRLATGIVPVSCASLWLAAI